MLISAIILMILIVGLFVFRHRIKINSKQKMLDEKLSMGITGFAAFSVVLIVLYLLVHIFLLGQSALSWDFLFSAPREGLTEGGIFPAIVGTALLVVIMSIVGVPIGTITAIYLSEYAKENSIISKSIRFAVNTLAGVPAIVFGLFGLGFFISTVGKQVDGFDSSKRMEKLQVILSSANLQDNKVNYIQLESLLKKNDPEYWKEQIEQCEILKEMRGEEKISSAESMKFFKERIRPHWAQPSLLWAALTMALLTLPVVIVSVEEAIKTVPKELREASLALGATKFETIRKVVLPGSITGILTGAILAVSRGAGEVAPILFTGAAYFLPELPQSVNSQFMELGYHIYVLATQSTNVEMTKPLQYATTLVLLILTFTLNFSAIILRSKLRARQA